jgi:quercetin dioxygenase-like cupin family protein
MKPQIRDAAVLAAGVVLGCSGWAFAQRAGDVLGPAVFDWNAMAATKTDSGEVRSIVRRPTATLRELEMHVTTLNPGLASHPPHKHPNEELVIIDEGTVETLSAGRWQRVGPGSIIFNASNALHALRNVGTTTARYHVVNWSTAATPANQDGK